MTHGNCYDCSSNGYIKKPNRVAKFLYRSEKLWEILNKESLLICKIRKMEIQILMAKPGETMF